MSDDAKRPKADPKAGLWVYGYNLMAVPAQYEDLTTREIIEDICRATLKDRKGLDATWSEWRFLPEADHEDEDTGRTVTLPAVWLFTCEALGPEGLKTNS